jgi:membrane protein YqaA with SNARE-associated domain
LHFIKHILARYTAFLWALLKPLGVWGAFAFAAVDSAALGMPLDPIVAGYVYADPQRFWLYALMASAGSAAGSIVIYLIGYAGGEVLLHRRMSPQKYERIRRAFDRHEFLALMLPAILPPPFPFKVIVLSAAAFKMNFVHFLAAIFAGRLVRFGVLSILTIKFGPQAVGLIGSVVRNHLWWVLAGIAAMGILWFAIRRARRPRLPAADE